MLISQAAVTVLRKCIENQTWAEGRVVEQPVDPIVDILDGQRDEEHQRPYIAIYVESAMSDSIGHDSRGQFTEVTIKISVIVGPGLIKTDGEYIASLDSSKAGMAVNFVASQINRALHHGNEPWVGLWRSLCRSIKKTSTRFVLVEIEDPVRVPCLEMTITANLLPEPLLDKPVTGFWSNLTDALRADGGGAYADALLAQIEAPDGLPSYALLQAQMNYTDEWLAATGTQPVDMDSVDDETGEAPLLTNVTISDLPDG